MAQDTAASESTGPAKANYITVLKNRGFLYLWIGQVVSQVGDYFAFLATMVVISGFSADPQATTLAVSGMMIAQTLPRLLFGMLAGVFVDRWDRRRTMLVSDLLRTVLALAFIPAFFDKNLFAMFALGFLLSAVGTLFNPAKGALIPRLVPKDQLLAANSLSQTTSMLSVLLGPAVGGFTMGVTGPGNEWVAFVVDSLSFAISAGAIWLMRVPGGAAAPSAEAHDGAGAQESSAVRKVWGEMLVGLRALVLNRAVATIALVFAVTMLGVGAVNVLFITFLKTGFGFESSELAWRISVIDIAFSIGMLGASLVVGNYLSHLAPRKLIVWGLPLAGAFLAVTGYLPNYPLVVLDNFLIGAMVAPINAGTSTLIQIIVPNRQLGRVGGGLNTVTDTASVISMSLAGVLGAALGIPMVFLLGGLMCIAGGALAIAFIPGLTLKDKVEESGEAAPAGQAKEMEPEPAA